MLKWQAHLACVKLISQHPDWADEQVREAAGLHKLEMGIVAEARREAGAEKGRRDD